MDNIAITAFEDIKPGLFHINMRVKCVEKTMHLLKLFDMASFIFANEINTTMKGCAFANSYSHVFPQIKTGHWYILKDVHIKNKRNLYNNTTDHDCEVILENYTKIIDITDKMVDENVNNEEQAPSNMFDDEFFGELITEDEQLPVKKEPKTVEKVPASTIVPSITEDNNKPTCSKNLTNTKYDFSVVLPEVLNSNVPTKKLPEDIIQHLNETFYLCKNNNSETNFVNILMNLSELTRKMTANAPEKAEKAEKESQKEEMETEIDQTPSTSSQTKKRKLEEDGKETNELNINKENLSANANSPRTPKLKFRKLEELQDEQAHRPIQMQIQQRAQPNQTALNNTNAAEQPELTYEYIKLTIRDCLTVKQLDKPMYYQKGLVIFSRVQLTGYLISCLTYGDTYMCQLVDCTDQISLSVNSKHFFNLQKLEFDIFCANQSDNNDKDLQSAIRQGVVYVKINGELKESQVSQRRYVKADTIKVLCINSELNNLKEFYER